MSWVAVAVTGATLVGGYLQGQAAGRAADAQMNAANQANQLSASQYQQTRVDQAPWREAGARALSQMEDPSFQRTFSAQDFKADPGYQFRLAEGQKALARASSASGLFSSGTMKQLTKYNQGMASDEYNNAYNRFNADQTNRFNRLSSLAGLGQTSANTVAQAGQNYASQAGQNMMGAGNAQAAATIAQGNTLTNSINNGANTWMQMQMMNRFAPQGAA